MKRFRILSSSIFALSLLCAGSNASAEGNWVWKSFETRKNSSGWQNDAVNWLKSVNAEAEDVRCNLFEGHKFFLWAREDDDTGDDFVFETRSWNVGGWPDTIATELGAETATPCGFNLEAKVWVLKKK